MQRAALTVIFVTCGFAAGLTQTNAHHSFTRYDSSKKVTISGTVSSVRFQNPHVFFSLETAGGTIKVEAESPSVLRSRGLTDAVLSDGAKAVVTGWRSKTGAAEFGLSSVSIGGKSYAIRGSAR